MTFDIKNSILKGLRDNLFDGQAICDPSEYLSKLYETCSMCKPCDADKTNDQVKLRLFGFSLIVMEK